MDKFKNIAALVIGSIFLYDFIITLFSKSDQVYDVIGLEVSRITYLAYLLAISVSFLSYGFTKQSEKKDSVNQTVSDND